MNLKEIVDYLASNKYIVEINKKYVFTAKFNREISGLDLGVVIAPKPSELVVLEEVVPSKVEVKKEDWNLLYTNLIIEAKVPSHSYGARGDTYEVNKATKSGREAFKKAVIANKLDLTKLAQVVSDYYNSNNNRFRVKIETYFVEELWRNEYNNLTTTGKKETKDGARIKFG